MNFVFDQWKATSRRHVLSFGQPPANSAPSIRLPTWLGGLYRLAVLGPAGLPGSLAAAGPAEVTCVGKASDQATYTGASGATYKILCGIDYSGSDLSATQTPTFAGCIDACDSTPGCIDVSYAGEACYLKHRIETGFEREWVWSAKQITPAPGATPKVTCVDKQSDKATYTSSTGAVFQVLCGVDYGGGDVGATNSATFEGCIDACAATDGCIDVSYVGEACYLKNKAEEAQASDWVWTAKLVTNGNGGGSTTPS